MVRLAFIERIRRFIYNGQPTSDATITIGLVNNYLNDAIGAAAKQNYKDNKILDGISCVNNSFYTTFKNLPVTQDEQFLYKVVLPQIPVGIGANEGLPTLQFRDNQSNQISQTVVFLTQNQKTFFDSMRPIPNKLIAYYEGKNAYIKSTIMLSQYTAHATMVSGGVSTDLYSELNVPPDYFPMMQEYLVKVLMMERMNPVDGQNDGLDAVKTT